MRYQKKIYPTSGRMATTPTNYDGESISMVLDRRSDGTLSMKGVRTVLEHVDRMAAAWRDGGGTMSNAAVKRRLLESDPVVQEFNGTHKAVLDLWLHDGDAAEMDVMRTNLLDMISTHTKLEEGGLSEHEKDMAVAQCNHRIIEACKEEDETPEQRRQRLKDAIRSKQKSRARKG